VNTNKIQAVNEEFLDQTILRPEGSPQMSPEDKTEKNDNEKQKRAAFVQEVKWYRGGRPKGETRFCNEGASRPA